MFSREFGLFGITFIFIFGWKVTEIVDLILLSSLGIAAWVYVVSKGRIARHELEIAGSLVLLVIYSTGVTIVFGAVDLQSALRAVRALLNFAGALGLVAIYYAAYRERAAQRIAIAIYLSVTLHAILICLMFASPGLRALVYGVASTLDYVNANAPILLGLRIPGLTYGLASTSVVQFTGILLLPLMLRATAGSMLSRLSLWLSVVPLLVSIFLTGRTGLLFTLACIPLLLVFSGRDARPVNPAQASSAVWRWIPLAFVGIGVAVIALRYGESLQETFSYTIKHSSEIFEIMESGGSRTTETLSNMYFLPDEASTVLFGSSNLGRGALGYIESDVGYIKLIFAVGCLGLLLYLVPYLAGLRLAAHCYLRCDRMLALVTVLSLAAGLLLNFKELALLTRNQWSIQSMLIAACALQLRHAAAGSWLEAPRNA